MRGVSGRWRRSSTLAGRERIRLAASLTHEFPTTGVVLTASAIASKHLPASPVDVCCQVVKPSSPQEIVDAVQRAYALRQRPANDLRVERAAIAAAIERRQQRLTDTIAHAATADAAFAALRHTFAGRAPALLAHSRRVAQTARQIAEVLFLPTEIAHDVAGAALLHDIGKLTLPEAVLHGDLPLGDAEIEALGNHHARTLDMLSHAPRLAAHAAIVEHAEARWDGTGVPWGLAGQDIHLGARIVAVADAVDAARSREGAQRSDARLTVLARAAGTRLDPDLVRVCLHTLESAGATAAPSSRIKAGLRCS
jgi:HD-GYP domain-containing protein (c-di-GMP phosphodiesterase class II)